MPHFLALVKALEEHYDFHFETMELVAIDQNAVPGVTVTKIISVKYVCGRCGLFLHLAPELPPPVCPDCGIKHPYMMVHQND